MQDLRASTIGYSRKQLIDSLDQLNTKLVAEELGVHERMVTAVRDGTAKPSTKELTTLQRIRRRAKRLQRELKDQQWIEDTQPEIEALFHEASASITPLPTPKGGLLSLLFGW